MRFTLEALGLVIQERRAEMDPKLSQDELGVMAGYSSGDSKGAAVSVSRIERGLTRPGPERFAGLAMALGLTPGQLEASAANKSLMLAKQRGEAPDGEPNDGGVEERIRDRVKRVQQEIDSRNSVITELGTAFNDADGRARDQFLRPFVEFAAGIIGAPQPDPAGLDDDIEDGPAAEATYRIRYTSYGVRRVLAGGMGGAAGALVGGGAAYGTFMAALTFGTASTGTAIAGLSGAAASSAAMALLGGGTLASGGLGIAGGAALLAGIVAGPALVLALGGFLWMRNRNRKQQQAFAEQLDQVEVELAATRRGYEALADILPQATERLEYIALHAGHALNRWQNQLGHPPVEWDAMDEAGRNSYMNFAEISASQLSVVSINVQDLMAKRGADLEELIEFADEVLVQTKAKVESLV